MMEIFEYVPNLRSKHYTGKNECSIVFSFKMHDIELLGLLSWNTASKRGLI